MKTMATRAACDSMEMNGAKVAMAGGNTCAATTEQPYGNAAISRLRGPGRPAN